MVRSLVAYGFVGARLGWIDGARLEYNDGARLGYIRLQLPPSQINL